LLIYETHNQKFKGKLQDFWIDGVSICSDRGLNPCPEWGWRSMLQGFVSGFFLIEFEIFLDKKNQDI
jgi:hypothetical protein